MLLLCLPSKKAGLIAFAYVSRLLYQSQMFSKINVKCFIHINQSDCSLKFPDIGES